MVSDQRKRPMVRAATDTEIVNIVCSNLVAAFWSARVYCALLGERAPADMLDDDELATKILCQWGKFNVALKETQQILMEEAEGEQKQK